LEASNRLPLVFNKLEEAMNTDQQKNAIVCLQEVSYDWAGAFHTWFANRGYHLVTGLYGKKFNGYMGVAIAYPTEPYDTVDVDISRLSDKRVDGWPREEEPSLPAKLVNKVNSLVVLPLRAVGLMETPKEDHWSMSERRYNVLVTVTLKDKKTGRSMLIGNYHMPCAFYAPMAMTIHAEMAARHVQDLAKSNGDIPYVLAGDWNIRPKDSDTSPIYQMMIDGKMDRDSPCYPMPKHGMEWRCTIEPMRSAYAVKNGTEPDFTNYARVEERDPFIDTLDYIFLSSGWTVTAVKPLVHRDEANGPFPNAKEPSDHVLIWADLEVCTDQKPSEA
jgi:exonuclease III